MQAYGLDFMGVPLGPPICPLLVWHDTDLNLYVVMQRRQRHHDFRNAARGNASTVSGNYDYDSEAGVSSRPEWVCIAHIYICCSR